MATASGDIATLVFKRNISSTMESYVLDFQMLKVLDEIDGIRGVAEIAARLDTVVSDVKATCARLFQQRLILPARPRAAPPDASDQRALSHGPQSELGESISDSTPDEAHEFKVDEEAFPTSASGAPQPAREVVPDLPQASTLFHLEPGEDSPAAGASVDEGGAAGSAGLWDRGESGSEPRSAASLRNGPSDIFSIARTPADEPGGMRSNGFIAPPETGQAGSVPDPPFAGGLRAGDSGREEWAQRQGNIEAIEHFEEGLAALQSGALKEALRQFETALALDPQNRLCRANIQRIQAKIASQEA